MRPSPGVFGLAFALILLALVFGAIERVAPAVPGVRLFRRNRVPDFLYWFLTPLFTRGASKLLLGLLVAIVAGIVGFKGGPIAFVAELQRRSPLSRIPLGPQLLLALLVFDFFSYWIHRAFHGARLWKFHAIHHSATQLDWLAATRLHPVNDWIAKLVAAPVLLLGFKLEIFAAVLPILTVWAIFIHANVNWGFGPLKYVVATPLFHRWHHTSEAEGLDRNFAGLFPVYDWLFGTLYLPSGKAPRVFGVTNEAVPVGFFGQLAYPFRRG